VSAVAVGSPTVGGTVVADSVRPRTGPLALQLMMIGDRYRLGIPGLVGLLVTVA
jgi:hypothetical protein